MYQPAWCSCGCCTQSEGDMCCDNAVRQQNCCVTHLEEMTSCVLNTTVLRMLCQQLMCGQTSEVRRKLREDSHAKLRFLAYHNYALWVNSVVNPGDNYAVDIPACVIRVVRENFPEQREHKFDVSLEGDFMLLYPA